MEPGLAVLGSGCTTSPAPNGKGAVCGTFTEGTLIVSDFGGMFCNRLLPVGYDAGGAPGTIDDEDKEEFPGECNMGLVELDEGGDDEPFDDVDESSAVDIPPPPLPELEIDVA